MEGGTPRARPAPSHPLQPSAPLLSNSSSKRAPLQARISPSAHRSGLLGRAPRNRAPRARAVSNPASLVPSFPPPPRDPARLLEQVRVPRLRLYGWRWGWRRGFPGSTLLWRPTCSWFLARERAREPPSSFVLQPPYRVCPPPKSSRGQRPRSWGSQWTVRAHGRRDTPTCPITVTIHPSPPETASLLLELGSRSIGIFRHTTLELGGPERAYPREHLPMSSQVASRPPCTAPGNPARLLEHARVPALVQRGAPG